MPKKALRILSGFLVAVLISIAIVPVCAAESEYVSKESFWNWVASSGDVAQGILSHLPFIGSKDNVCSKSEDGYHHASSYVAVGTGFGKGYYDCICTYCGIKFTAYETDLSTAYNDYVQTLPSPNFSSTDHMIWSPTVEDVLQVAYSNVMAPPPVLYDIDNLPGFLTPLNRGNGFYFNGTFSGPSLNSHATHGILFQCQFLAPVTGKYKLLAATRAVGEIILFGDSAVSCYSDYSEASSFVHLDAGSRVWTPNARYFSDACVGNYPVDFSYNWYFPVFEIISDTISDEYDKYYNITTRPTSITGGNYGIVGDNGQITTVEGSSTIVNETNNTYYNPATGQTVPIAGWSYDYSDRSYTVTTETGDTVTITYGDENITIREGDTVYNVYYLVDSSGSENPVCVHDWQQTGTTPAACTRPGSAVYTCSKCQQTKTETLPTLGHTWQVKQSVTTQYDETGQLIQQGYTIYQCSTCGEQYKDDNGTGPPGSSGTAPGGEEGETIWDKLGNLLGTVLGGLISMAAAVLGKILDALISLAAMLMEGLRTVVDTVLALFEELPKLFAGFLAFLCAVFPFLPPEIMTLLTFGVVAVVFIGILKAVRR